MGDQSQTKTRPAEDFCRSCGLCCNGTLYARVPLVPSDSLDSLSRAGASVDGPGENRALSLPCGAFAKSVLPSVLPFILRKNSHIDT